MSKKKIAAIGIVIVLAIAVTFFMTLSFVGVSVGDFSKSIDLAKARQMCIKNQTIGALEYLQQVGGMNSETYPVAEKRLIAASEKKCDKYAEVQLLFHAKEGLFDIPIERENELRKDCEMSGGHWDIGCRFAEAIKNNP